MEDARNNFLALILSTRKYFYCFFFKQDWFFWYTSGNSSKEVVYNTDTILRQIEMMVKVG